MTDPFFSFFSVQYRYVRPDNVTAVQAIAKEVRARRLVSHCEAFIESNRSFVTAFEQAEAS